ncbi:hypothetical protein B0T19DRAFT_416970 [Cercophora scortea]|uniref:Secreted protein n=1 Tax=Cercophora scortea TaxID=314031 RepID=A0AAE0IY28_9PEZI|nr:hypothetical protein B0T19DRAFT_416970 [Cercophora scortea]
MFCSLLSSTARISTSFCLAFVIRASTHVEADQCCQRGLGSGQYSGVSSGSRGLSLPDSGGCERVISRQDIFAAASNVKPAQKQLK